MAHPESWSHQSEFAADASSVPAARRFVDRCLSTHDLDALTDDVRLVVSELATNATIHARTPFKVTVSGNETTVLLTVGDGSAETPVPISAAPLAPGGRGLALVEDFSAAWGVKQGRGHAKSVWASFGLHQR